MSVAFVVKPLVSQSGDNTNLIIIDSSNYTTNTEGITSAEVISRSVAVTDSMGNAVATVLLVADGNGNFTGELPVIADFFYSYLLTITLPASVVKTGNTTYVSTGYYNAVFISVMTKQLGDCGCCSGTLCTNLFWASQNYNASIIFGAKNLGDLAQQSIDAANQFVNSAING